MSRSVAIVFVILGAALAGFAVSSATGRLDGDASVDKPSVAAPPQSAWLSWHETYGRAGSQLVFEVEGLDVLADGWRASIELTNNTPVAWEVGDPRATLDRAFGLMLFATGNVAELERRNSNGTLPATRPASRYQPSLPLVLKPGASWQGTISARGSLVADSWVRVVFGTLLAVSDPGGDLDDKVVWITDHAYQLKP